MIDQLDVLTARHDDRAHLKNLWERAMFFSEAERLSVCQKLKMNHLMGADRGSKYFHSLIKSNNRSKSINRVVDESGNLTTSMDQVHSAFVHYYSNLFGVQGERVSCIKGIISTGVCITLAQSEALISPVSDTEIKQAVFDMGDNKAPGLDGFSAGLDRPSFLL